MPTPKGHGSNSAASKKITEQVFTVVKIGNLFKKNLFTTFVLLPLAGDICLIFIYSQQFIVPK